MATTNTKRVSINDQLIAATHQEVRNLAMRAAEAAKNTSNLIEGTVKKVKDGSELVGRTNEAFQQVAGSSAKVADLVAEIAAASNEQAQGIGQINTAVTELDKVTQQNAANAEESAILAGVANVGYSTWFGFAGYVKYHKPFFIGRDALLAQDLKRKRELVRWRMDQKGVRRPGTQAPVVNKQGQVIGVPDQRLGEVPAAYVIANEGACVEPQELLEWCRARCANFKVRLIKKRDLGDPLPEVSQQRQPGRSGSPGCRALYAGDSKSPQHQFSRSNVTRNH